MCVVVVVVVFVNILIFPLVDCFLSKTFTLLTFSQGYCLYVLVVSDLLFLFSLFYFFPFLFVTLSFPTHTSPFPNLDLHPKFSEYVTASPPIFFRFFFVFFFNQNKF